MSADGDSGSLTPRQRRSLTSMRSDRAIVATLAAAGLLAALMQTSSRRSSRACRRC